MEDHQYYASFQIQLIIFRLAHNETITDLVRSLKATLFKLLQHLTKSCSIEANGI